MQITNIEFSLGNKKETIKDLSKLNPDWVIDKILDKTGIETRYIIDEGENEKTLVTDACKKLFEMIPDRLPEAVKDWIQKQNEFTSSYLERIPYRDSLKNRLEELWDYKKIL